MGMRKIGKVKWLELSDLESSRLSLYEIEHYPASLKDYFSSKIGSLMKWEDGEWVEWEWTYSDYCERPTKRIEWIEHLKKKT